MKTILYDEAMKVNTVCKEEEQWNGRNGKIPRQKKDIQAGLTTQCI